jgi:cell division septum initiation protein DivIVA
MTDAPTNLVLEQLRLIRADISAVKTDIADLSARVENIDTQLQGLTYVVTTAIGSLAMEMKGLKNRVEALEEA